MESKKIVCPNCHGTLEVTNPKQEPLLMIKCPNPACGAKLRIRFDTGETVLAPQKAAVKVPYFCWHLINFFRCPYVRENCLHPSICGSYNFNEAVSATH